MPSSTPIAHLQVSLTVAQATAAIDAILSISRGQKKAMYLQTGKVRVLAYKSPTKFAITNASPAIPSFRSLAIPALIVMIDHVLGRAVALAFAPDLALRGQNRVLPSPSMVFGG